jgi:hypothetical protein
MTGVDWMGPHDLWGDERIKQMVERVQSPLDRRGRASLVMVGVKKAFDLTAGDLGQRSIAVSEAQLAIQEITVKGIDRVVSPLPGRANALEGDAAMQRSPLEPGLPWFQPRHGGIVLGACGGLLELRVAQGHPDGAGAPQLVPDLHTRSRMQAWCRTGMASRVRRVRRGDLGRAERRGQPGLEGPDAQRRAGCQGAWPHGHRLRRVGAAPWAQGVRDIRRIRDHAIEQPLAVVDPDGPGLGVDGGPGQGADFSDPEATAPHQQPQEAVA